MRCQHPNISTNKMSPYHFSSNPRSKRWQICTACCCPRARDQMPSPGFDFNPICNFSRNINFNIFIIERLSHKNGPVDPNRISINFRPIRFPGSFLTKSFQYFMDFFSRERLWEWHKGCCQWRCLIILACHCQGSCNIHSLSDWLQSWKYEALIGPLLQLIRNVTYGFPFLQIITACARIRFVSILSLAVI